MSLSALVEVETVTMGDVVAADDTTELTSRERGTQRRHGPMGQLRSRAMSWAGDELPTEFLWISRRLVREVVENDVPRRGPGRLKSVGAKAAPAGVGGEAIWESRTHSTDQDFAFRATRIVRP